jgi:hypothetical protein
MRLCPARTSPLEVSGDDEFEQCCELSYTERPGPMNTVWWMKLRGKDGGLQLDELVSGDSNDQEPFVFGDKPDSEPSPATCTAPKNISFPMIYRGLKFQFEGMKVADVEMWSELDAHSQKSPSESSTDSSKSTVESDENPDFILEVSSSIPSTGPQAAMTPLSSNPDCIEPKPEWAFPVRGQWDVTNTSGLATHFSVPRGEVKIYIGLTNNPRHKVLRQLWGKFQFGSGAQMKFGGVSRFLPWYIKFRGQRAGVNPRFRVGLHPAIGMLAWAVS